MNLKRGCGHSLIEVTMWELRGIVKILEFLW